MAFARILVGSDFSDASGAALRVAAELAAAGAGRVTICHVVELPALAYLTPGALALEGDALVGALSAERRPELAALAAALARRSGLVVDSRLVVGRAAPALVAVARDGGFDLLVVGTHGRGGLARLLVGSVAAEVMRTAGCPVLTVPPPAAVEAVAP